jgi:hypothetical protein
MRRRTLLAGLAGGASVGLAATTLALVWDHLWEKRVRAVVLGRLYRGAWQKPGPLRRLLDREHIRTIVTLTAINRDDPKYVEQERVVAETGVGWILVPMRGSTATIEQMAAAADRLADPALQPVYFHCVAGHHRTSLAHAAYLIRHGGLTAEQAWQVVSELPWSRPSAESDTQDYRRILDFARQHRRIVPARTIVIKESPPQWPGLALD